MSGNIVRLPGAPSSKQETALRGMRHHLTRRQFSLNETRELAEVMVALIDAVAPDIASEDRAAPRNVS